MADVKLSQLAATSPASVAAGAALWTFPGHISGLALERVAANQLRATTGSAYIQSLGYGISVATAILKTGMTLTANTWYYVYLYMNGATPDIEFVTTAPAAAYNGIARSKTGDQTRRFIGAFKSAAANVIGQVVQASDYEKTDVYAELSANAAIPAAAATKLIYDVEVRDLKGEYNNATGEWTCAAPGFYAVSAFAYFSAMGDQESITVNGYVNGVETFRLVEATVSAPGPASKGVQGGSTVMRYFNPGDVLDIRVYRQLAGQIANFPFTTFFAVKRLD